MDKDSHKAFVLNELEKSAARLEDDLTEMESLSDHLNNYLLAQSISCLIAHFEITKLIISEHVGGHHGS